MLLRYTYFVRFLKRNFSVLFILFNDFKVIGSPDNVSSKTQPVIIVDNLSFQLEYKYRLLMLNLWLVALRYISSYGWTIFMLLLLILVIPTVHTR